MLQQDASSNPTGEWVPLATLLTSIGIAPEQSSGYSRDDWNHWTDDDGDGLDTRQEVLADESLSSPEIASGRVHDGTWTSAYDGIQTENPSELDIDHVVPLAEAHQSGGWAWDTLTRQLYANDLDFPEHLMAVSASSNRSKGAKDPAEWLPPNDEALCTYLAWWTTIKFRWKLFMDQSEYESISHHAETNCAETQINLKAAVELGIIQAAFPENSSATPTATPNGACHPAYSPCLPIVADLDCNDIYELNLSHITVTDPDNDPYRLDANKDGTGCTSP